MQDNKKYKDDGTVTTEKVTKICDCVSEKMFAMWKCKLNAD